MDDKLWKNQKVIKNYDCDWWKSDWQLFADILSCIDSFTALASKKLLRMDEKHRAVHLLIVVFISEREVFRDVDRVIRKQRNYHHKIEDVR